MSVIVVCLLLSISVVSALADNDSEVVARVNGKDITQADFFEALQREAGAFILSQMILDELIEQKQIELDVYISEEDLMAVLTNVITQLGGMEGLQMFLMQNEISEDQLIDQIEWNLLISTLAMAEVSVSDQEIEEFFAENASLFDSIEASHILVETEEEAAPLLAEINAGADFATLAKENSTDPVSGPKGGGLDFFRRGQMVPSFEDKVFSLAIDEAGIVESQLGWHVILVTDQKAAEFDEVKDEIKNYLKEMKAKSPAEYVDHLGESAQVEILDARYSSLLSF